MKEVFEQVDHLAVAQGHLLGLALRMLNNVHVLAHQNRVVIFHGAIPAEPGEVTTCLAPRGDRNQGEVKPVTFSGVGQEQQVRPKHERFRSPLAAVGVFFHAKFDNAGRRSGFIGQDVVVCQQESRADQ